MAPKGVLFSYSGISYVERTLMSFLKGIPMNKQVVTKLENMFGRELVQEVVREVLTRAIETELGVGTVTVTTHTEHQPTPTFKASATSIKGGTKWRTLSPLKKAHLVIANNVRRGTTAAFAKDVGATETAVRAFVWKHKLSGKTKLPKSFN